MKNYYDILEVSKNASDKVISAAYKALTKKYHPDVYQGNKEFAEKKMKQINEAYETLNDASKRAEYDATLNLRNDEEDETEYVSPEPERTPPPSYPQSNTDDNTSKAKGPWCGCIILLILIIICGISMVYSFAKALFGNSNDTSAKTSSSVYSGTPTASSVKSSENDSSSSPEYWTDKYIQLMKSRDEVNPDGIRFYSEDLQNYSVEYFTFVQNNISASMGSDKFYYDMTDDQFNQFVDFSYNVYEASYIDSETATVFVGIYFTDLYKFMEKSSEYALVEYNTMLKTDKNASYSAILGNYVEQHYKENLKTYYQSATFTLKKRNNCWQIVDCDDFDGLLAACSANLMGFCSDFSSSEYEQYSNQDFSYETMDIDEIYRKIEMYPVNDTSKEIEATNMVRSYLKEDPITSYMYIGRADSNGSLTDGYVFLPAENGMISDFSYMLYACPDKKKIFVAYLGSEYYCVWKDELPNQSEKAVDLVRSLTNGNPEYVDTFGDSYILFDNGNSFRVLWDCSKVYYCTYDPDIDKSYEGKEIYPTDTIGFFERSDSLQNSEN